MYKVIVAGSRPPKNSSEFLIKKYKEFVLNTLDELCKGYDIEIISGMCHGPDMYAVEWAERNKINIIKCPADWDGLGKRAGYVRNSEMANNYGATHLIVFWDGKSKGTKHMIDIANAAGLKVKIIRVNFKEM